MEVKRLYTGAAALVLVLGQTLGQACQSAQTKSGSVAQPSPPATKNNITIANEYVQTQVNTL
ncbi:hypothetical protein [Aliikangiella coralliicola]|uniref:Uncharacterized protein n=1 Tax=Aliikangiella coralliicola TaxID=2592383 RepID=A0A545U956_9GAMM|nr:hypothetical protein [Aliikangiella coralliicola]TQV85943.1 hypothetical protein FLL46_18670 [Aliikangiella coralliicola]